MEDWNVGKLECRKKTIPATSLLCHSLAPLSYLFYIASANN